MWTSAQGRVRGAVVALLLLAGGALESCAYSFGRDWEDGGSSHVSELGFADRFPSADGPMGPGPDGQAPPKDSIVPPADTGSPDAGAPDTAVPPEPPCAQGQPSKTFGPRMVVCSLGSASPQCAAGSACNARGGWSLCTASQFLARGGADQPVEGAWIGGCIRSGGGPHAAQDGVCGSCLAKGIDDVNFAWPCPPLQGAFHGTPDYIGVKTSIQCWRLGIDDLSAQAYWEWEVVQNGLSKAVCCD